MRESPTQLSLKHYRKLGWTVEVVERWNPHARIRQDLFGFIDLIAIREDHRPLGIQACARSSIASRHTKILASPLYPVVSSVFDLVVIGWDKTLAIKGGKKMIYRSKERLVEP